MDAFTWGVILVVVASIGAVALIRRAFANAEGHAEPHSPEYDEAIQKRDELKTGRLWGDIPNDPGHR